MKSGTKWKELKINIVINNKHGHLIDVRAIGLNKVRRPTLK